MLLEFNNLRLDRRDFLKTLALAGLIASTSQLPDNRNLSKVHFDSGTDFDPNRLGTNIVPEQASWYGLNYDEVIETQLSLPFNRVRIPIRFSDVNPAKGEFDFSKPDALIEKAISYGKLIDMQLGIKTIGHPEIHAPEWLYHRFPYLRDSYTQLDLHPDVKDFIIQYIDETWKHYREKLQISSVQVENEPYSLLLDVTRQRWLSFEFNMEEISHLKAMDPLNRPIVQNFPWDNPSVWKAMLTSSNIDILGVNVYNNIYIEFLNKLLWAYIEKTFEDAKAYKKSVHITEYQVATWLNDDKSPKYPFDPEKREDGLRRLRELNPEGLHFWDIPQLIWRSKNGDTDAETFLYHFLPKLTA